MTGWLFEVLSEVVVPAISSFFGEESIISSIISGNPWLILVLLALPLIVLLFIALFFDFIKDAWKMPFAIALDVAAFFLFLADPFYIFILALVTGAVFYVLAHSQRHLRWIYAITGMAKMILILPIVPIPEVFKIILVLVPLCTIEMFFACITD